MGHAPPRRSQPRRALPTRLDAAKAAFVSQDFIGPAEVEAFEAEVERLLADGTADDTHRLIGAPPPPPPHPARGVDRIAAPVFEAPLMDRVPG